MGRENECANEGERESERESCVKRGIRGMCGTAEDDDKVYFYFTYSLLCERMYVCGPILFLVSGLCESSRYEYKRLPFFLSFFLSVSVVPSDA